MAMEKDAGRDVKKTGLLAGVAFIALAAGYLFIAWLNRPADSVSHISLDKVTSGSGKAAPESPEYRSLLTQYNADKAQQAADSDGSFIASMHTSPAPVTAPPAPPPPPTDTPSRPTTTTRPVLSGLDPDRKKAVDTLLSSLATQWQPAQGRLASAMGSESVGESAPGGQAGSPVSGSQTSTFSGWTQSVMPAVSRTEAAGQPAAFNRTLIAAGTRTPAVIDTAVDSDNTRSQVTAHVPAGPYAGALFIAHDVQLAGDGVAIHFTEMTWHDICYGVDVWAEQDDTLQASVASDVNHRYFSRIILPAFAHGIGQVGQLYEDANTQILSTDYGEVTANVDMPDGEAVAGTIVGGMADKAGQVLESDAQKLPVTQVTVTRGQTVALLFTKSVKDSDNLDKTTAVATPASASSGVPAAPVPAGQAPASALSPAPTDTHRGFPRRYYRTN